MTLKPQPRRLLQSTAALAIVVAVTLGTPLLAGADWPTTPGGTPNNQVGVCNIQYNVDGQLIFGYVISFNCNAAVPTADGTSFWVDPFLCGNYAGSGRSIACPTTSAGIPGDQLGVQDYTSNIESGSTTCDKNHTLWLGYLPHTGTREACTNPVSPEAGLTTSPPGDYVAGTDLYGYVNINNESTGTASAGYVPISLQGSYTVTVDTYPAIGPAADPEESWLDQAGGCSGFSTDNANLLLTGANNGAALSQYGGSSSAGWGELEIQNVTCHNGTTTYPTAPTTSYAGGAAALLDGPCTLDGVTGNSSSDQPKANYDYPYTIDFDGPTQLIVVDPADGSTPTQTIDGKTFSANANDIHAPPTLQSPATIDVNIATNTYGIDPHLWCYNAGTWYDWGLVEDDQSVVPTACTLDCSQSQLSICLQNSANGMDLYNPVTWVEGGLTDLECILQWLTVPQSCTPSEVDVVTCVNWSAFVNNVGTREPFSYLADAYNAVNTMNAGLTSAIADGACDTQTIAPWAGDSTGVGKYLAGFSVTPPAPSDLGCSGSNDATVGNIFGARPWIYLFEEFGFWLTTIAIIWRMLPWAKAGDAMETLERMGALDIWGRYAHKLEDELRE